MNKGRDRRGDWLSPEAYSALSTSEKRAIWLDRKQRSQSNRHGFYKNQKTARRMSSSGIILVAAAMVGAIAWELAPADRIDNPAAPSATGLRADFSLCRTGGGTNCVVDGDTLWVAGENIRIANIDAPETHDFDCEEEKALGDKATLRLHNLVNRGIVTLEAIDRDQDVYGRKLRLVLVDGVDVGDTLVNDGLARYYRGGKRPWC